MTIISTRDFRANQSKYLEMANRGENVILKSRGFGSFKIVPVETVETETRDLMRELRDALHEVKEHIDGKIELKSAKSLIDEL